MKKCLTLPAIRELETSGFCVATQPIVTGDVHGIPRVSGHELLPRFREDENSLSGPDKFEGGLSRDQLATLDAFMVQEAIGSAVSAETFDLFFSFNLRAAHLADAGFSDFLLSRLDVMSTVERSRLMVEISGCHLADGKLFSNYLPRLKKTLLKLAQMGVKICVDKFSHRSNGFRLASQLPVNAVKFSPEALLAEMRFHKGDCDESEAIDLEVMRSFGLSMKAWRCLVIAEGIEARAHTAFADGLGATHYQGSAFGQPLVESELPDDLEEPEAINRSYRGGDREVNKIPAHSPC
ncbi:EAL domain-containing protein [Marinobacter sp.]|uniref:EAL domain-containing protein n=1 Tax=Marinobacter sp. TaxID=50741 RepID=UPI0035612DCB